MGEKPTAVSRRTFIKGVIAGGAAVASANYLFRASTLLGQTPVAGVGERLMLKIQRQAADLVAIPFGC